MLSLIALKGQDEHIGDIVCDAIPLCKNDSKYRFLFANHTFHLNAQSGPSTSDASCLAIAIDSGTILFFLNTNHTNQPPPNT